ncbi:MAG: outer membrane lipoprotein carrier protein LolA [Alphaproteobacteria bacterium]|nr:outer membrane lipoprotein carrier protein LolA [Alphaproteobacteria bacterium]
MAKHPFRWLAPAILILCLSTGVTAAEIIPTQAQRETLDEIETYLNDIRSMHARFVQFDEAGGVVAGDLYLRRPGQLRFEYTPPSPILIVATGRTLVFFDAELDQVTYLPLSATPLAFLVADQFSFAHKDIEVIGIQRDPGVISVAIVDPDNPEEGEVTLVFSDAPLTLRQWRVVDAQGKKTTVALSEIRTNLALDDALFRFVDPNPFRNTDPDRN